MSAKRLSNVFPMVSVRTRLPAMKATPRSTAKLVVRTRSFRCRSPAMVVLSIGALLAELLEPVEHPLGGRVLHLVDDPSVVQEDHAAGVGGRHRVVRHHHDGLPQLLHRPLHE